MVSPAASNSVGHGSAPDGAGLVSYCSGVERSSTRRPCGSSTIRCESVSRAGGSVSVTVNGDASDIIDTGLVRYHQTYASGGPLARRDQRPGEGSVVMIQLM